MTEELIMDADSLKAAMAALGDRNGVLALPGTIAARKASHRVDALSRWQIVQIGAGIVIALAGGTVWSDLLAQPGLLFASGLLINLLGVGMIALGVAGLTHAQQIDVAAPIIETEGHMARLHRIKLVSGWVLGASWWVLWLPCMAVAVRLLWGADMLAPIGTSAWLITTLVSGVVGWAGTWGLRRWAFRNGRVHLATRIDDMMTGRAFREAQRRLKEVARFAAD
ncbi:hypothetical protein [Sphingomonas aerophila]|jgi:hypothetical protein|uniref:Serine/threonine protein kinase n=1 Tax=Sphingomonas aerophila TaxID=1344948 RepID=A0A7W9BGX5_9SPHN|nr:hypothetical protein [Sphingomonas aerophila]MBB5716982.1 hypothetical protein [Sphingomonas aerophila]